MRPVWRARFHARGLPILISVAVAAGALAISTGTARAMFDPTWAHQFGTPLADQTTVLSAVDDGVYAAGTYDTTTNRQLFIRRYATGGSLQWERSVATSDQAVLYVQALSGDAGGVYVGGSTYEALPGQTALHATRATWIQRYDASGNLLWTREFDAANTEPDKVYVGTTGAGVFVAANSEGAGGHSYDSVIRLYGSDGELRWERHLNGQELAEASADATGITLATNDFLVQRWTVDNTFSTSFPEFDTVEAMDTTPDGRLAVLVSRDNGGCGPQQFLDLFTGRGHLEFEVFVADCHEPARSMATRGLRAFLAYAVPNSAHHDARWDVYDLRNGALMGGAQLGRVLNGPVEISVGMSGGYVGGTTAPRWQFPGETLSGDGDAFVARFNDDVLPPLTQWNRISFPVGRIPPGVVTGAAHWSGSDDVAGIDHFDLQQSIASGSWSDVTLPDPLQTSLLVDEKPGQDYRFRVRAVDATKKVGAWAKSPNYQLDLLQESDTAFKYSAGWQAVARPGASDGEVMRATAAGATAKITISGDAVGLVVPLGKDLGRFTLFVDGLKAGVFDEHAPASVSPYVLFGRTWPKNGTHVLKIVVQGTTTDPAVALDAVEVAHASP